MTFLNILGLIFYATSTGYFLGSGLLKSSPIRLLIAIIAFIGSVYFLINILGGIK